MEAKSILVVVAEQIAKSGNDIVTTVVDKLAEVEISRRVDILTRAIQKQEPLEKELKKIDKTDEVHYVDDKPVESKSKQRYEDIKKAKEAIEKLATAIEKALADNSTEAYNKLDELLKK